jgi:hypothetical protein
MDVILICREQIIYDNLKYEHPQWPFTSYGAPFFQSLIHADLSFEEYHLAAMEANRNGTFASWVGSVLKSKLNYSNGKATNR